MESRFAPWISRLLIALIPVLVTLITISLGTDWIETSISALGIFVYLGVIVASENIVLHQVLKENEPRDTVNVISLQQMVALLVWIGLFLLVVEGLHPILLAFLFIFAIGWTLWIFHNHYGLYRLEVQRTLDIEQQIKENLTQQRQRVVANPEAVTLGDREVDLSGGDEE